MKIIKPEDAIFDSQTGFIISEVEEIIQIVNDAVTCSLFHYTTTKEMDYFVIAVHYNMVDGSINEAVRLLNEAGWDAKWQNDYCPHGPFKSIRIRTETINPGMIKFNTKA